MFYYYAHTNHKENLDGLRRGVAFAKELKSKNVDVKLLVNDFRAGIVARELGWDNVLNVETISDIDLVLEYGDKLLIDSTEELPLQFESFCRDYKVFRVANSDVDSTKFNEVMIYPWLGKENQAIFVDETYKEKLDKTSRVIYFFGDSDSSKKIVEYKDFFSLNQMEILLGHYFYVDYEAQLSPLFTKVYEADEYAEIIKTSSIVVTSSIQCALEAKSSGANTYFLSFEPLSDSQIDLLNRFGIELISDLNQSFAIDLSKNSIDITNIVDLETDYTLFLS